jgi:hypothetical protein
MIGLADGVKHFIGIGDSHLHAVTLALRDREAKRPDLIRYTPMCLLDAPFRPSFTDLNGVKVPNPAWVSALRDILDSGDDVSIFLYVGGSEPFRWSLTPGPAPFDFVDPTHDDGMPPVGQIVPYDLLIAYIREMTHYMHTVIGFLRTMTDLPLIQIVAPPPVRDLATMMAAEPALARQVSEFGVSPLNFRIKLWRAFGRALADACAKDDVPCLPCPPEALSALGCLRDDMIGDVVHGNAVWGHAVCRVLLERAGLMLELS